MAFPFDKGEEFAADKPACAACPNLSADFRCAIHDTLEADGYSGCMRYECLGAGQYVTQYVFAGQNWRDQPALMIPMAEAFAKLRQIHRSLELLLAARNLSLPAEFATERDALLEQHAPDTGWTPESLDQMDLSGLSKRTTAFLRSLRDYV